MFETSYSDSYGRRLRVHDEYGRQTLATAGLLLSLLLLFWSNEGTCVFSCLSVCSQEYSRSVERIWTKAD